MTCEIKYQTISFSPLSWQYADIVDLMVQGPAEDLEKLKEPLADFAPTYYPLAEGSIRCKKSW